MHLRTKLQFLASHATTWIRNHQVEMLFICSLNCLPSRPAQCQHHVSHVQRGKSCPPHKSAQKYSTAEWETHTSPSSA